MTHIMRIDEYASNRYAGGYDIYWCIWSLDQNGENIDVLYNSQNVTDKKFKSSEQAYDNAVNFIEEHKNEFARGRFGIEVYKDGDFEIGETFINGKLSNYHQTRKQQIVDIVIKSKISGYDNEIANNIADVVIDAFDDNEDGEWDYDTVFNVIEENGYSPVSAIDDTRVFDDFATMCKDISLVL